ncbi:MAG: ATP-binding protein [Bacteroidia bacterium]|nr:ATP-binding protein [Bacteroidia bacterium]
MPTIIPPKEGQSHPSESTNEPRSGGLFNKGKEEKFSFKEKEPRWSIDEIILDKNTREEIGDIIYFCQHQKELIEKYELDNFLKGRASVGINLYGEPGTGKSITAEAIAKALRKKVIEVNYSEVQSDKWGGTEKQLSALFEQAEASGNVIFMDEADGLMGKRQSEGANSETNNQIKSHLLTLIERSNVFIVYATNLFQNLDRAFFRRILFHVKFPMPKKDELVQLWKLHLGGKNIPKHPTDFSYETLADMSENLIAGGDIKNITMKLCVKHAVGRINELTNEIVKVEIEKYLKSIDDNKGIQREEQLEQTSIEQTNNSVNN